MSSKYPQQSCMPHCWFNDIRVCFPCRHWRVASPYSIFFVSFCGYVNQRILMVWSSPMPIYQKSKCCKIVGFAKTTDQRDIMECQMVDGRYGKVGCMLFGQSLSIFEWCHSNVGILWENPNYFHCPLTPVGINHFCWYDVVQRKKRRQLFQKQILN